MSDIKALEKIQAEMDEQIDALIKQRDEWSDVAIDIYRRFYPHEEYCIPKPEGIRDMVLKAVDERFMELPVDADGVPIRVGDMIEYEGDEDTYTLHARGVYVYDNGIVAVMNERLGIWLPENCHHVKPRTLEDIVIEYRLKAYNLYADSEMSGEERVEEFKTLDADVAAEIRELLGVDA